MENICHILKNELKSFKPRPTTLEQLENTLWHIWEEKITQEFCVNYVKAMLSRMNLII